MTKVELYAIGTSTTLESNKSLSKMQSNKINSLQSQHAPKTGFSHSLALEPTPYSVRCAPAFGHGSPPALGVIDEGRVHSAMRRFLQRAKPRW